MKVDGSTREWMRAHGSGWERMKVDESAREDESASEWMRAYESGWDRMGMDEGA